METHELLQLLNPDIQEAQIRSTQSLTNRRGHNGNTGRSEATGRPSPHIGQRQHQQWQQRPTATATATTCNGCRAQAPPGLRHIPRCHHYRAAQSGVQDNRSRSSDTNIHSRDIQSSQRTTLPQGKERHQSQFSNRQPTTNTSTPQVNVVTQEDVPRNDTQSATEIHIHSILTEEAGQGDDSYPTTPQSSWTPFPEQP
ncbi:hypothetical protein SARC_02177 [Sphaeroforma arctica JP610]|uniref:Uncharacterized protein n=1 Tax=Sphaeroforma arctica JP610 TaxID=667725 RepID=A0A0L0G9V7_9EUKA|nr:hypothetical protein SARC_02177 [Sphaeroforma arctica JP610]KNC85656.1 hypothetical protein SARC_02177 [Sphaeroforma arctica JP610]|eukprot:XP_014159558.1 hypothetical protein SARC_02177 [Sphaeroforma arctica JP610]